MGDDRIDLVPGTLDMLVLRALVPGALHGYAIVRRLQLQSDNVLQVEEGSLYPALHRMQRRGWIAARWGVSECNRRAKFYRLTARGRRQLRERVDVWRRMTTAIDAVLRATPERA